MARINYDKLKDRVCEYCKESYKPTGPAQKACETCRAHLASITRQVYHDIERYRKFGTYDRIGQGNSQGTGKQSPFYKNGTGLYLTTYRYLVKERRYCEECGKDLKDAGNHQWCCHHIDHDRTNNEMSNFKLLCKSCHAKEHKVINNIKGATTIPKGSTPE